MTDEECHLRLQQIMNEQREKERALIKNADFKTFKNLPHNWWLNTKLCKARIEDLIENIYNVPPYIVLQLPSFVIEEVLIRKKYELLKLFSGWYDLNSVFFNNFKEEIFNYVDQLKDEELFVFLDEGRLFKSKTMLAHLIEQKRKAFYFKFDNNVYDVEFVENYKSEFINAIDENTELKDIFRKNKILIKEALKCENWSSIIDKFIIIPEMFQDEKILNIYMEKLGINKKN